MLRRVETASEKVAEATIKRSELVSAAAKELWTREVRRLPGDFGPSGSLANIAICSPPSSPGPRPPERHAHRRRSVQTHPPIRLLKPDITFCPRRKRLYTKQGRRPRDVLTPSTIDTSGSDDGLEGGAEGGGVGLVPAGIPSVPMQAFEMPFAAHTKYTNSVCRTKPPAFAPLPNWADFRPLVRQQIDASVADSPPPRRAATEHFWDEELGELEHTTVNLADCTAYEPATARLERIHKQLADLREALTSETVAFSKRAFVDKGTMTADKEAERLERRSRAPQRRAPLEQLTEETRSVMELMDTVFVNNAAPPRWLNTPRFGSP